MLKVFLSLIQSELRIAYLLLSSIVMSFACHLYTTAPKADAMGGVALITVPIFASFLIIVVGLYFGHSRK